MIFINSCNNKTVDNKTVDDNIKDLDKDFENLRESYNKCDFCEIEFKIAKIFETYSREISGFTNAQIDQYRINHPEITLLEKKYGKKYELMEKWFENNFDDKLHSYIKQGSIRRRHNPDEIIDCPCLVEFKKYIKDREVERNIQQQRIRDSIQFIENSGDGLGGHGDNMSFRGEVEVKEEVTDANVSNIDQEGDKDLVAPPNDGPTESVGPEIFLVVEENAEFPGGVAAMGKFMRETMHYPAMAREAGISGKCFLKFVVNETGEISNVEVLKGVPGCADCDKEAIRVVKSMPKWKPAKMTGRSVKCYFNLPFSFKIQ